MNVTDLELVPGVVYSTSDPLQLGRVKASAPGLFNNNDMHDDAIPWLYPWGMHGYQKFSKLEVGAKVWVINNKNNLHECYYIPMQEHIDVVAKYLKDNYNNSPEILVFRNNGSSVASFTYDTVNGFKETIDKSHIQIKPSNEIDITANNANINLSGDKIKIGNTKDKYESAVKGDTLKSILYKLRNGLNTLKSRTVWLPFTLPLYSGVTECVNALSNIDSITANNTKLN